MKKIVVCALLCLFVAATFAGARDVVESPRSCKACGMDRTVFAHSRMLILYADGTSVGVCSLHCAAEERQLNQEKQIRALMVADYGTKELLDAGRATWVVGGKQPGVMTAQAKWAFARAEDARSFMAENGGRVNSLEQALNAATLEVMAQAAEARAVEQELLREQQQ